MAEDRRIRVATGLVAEPAITPCLAFGRGVAALEAKLFGLVAANLDLADFRVDEIGRPCVVGLRLFEQALAVQEEVLGPDSTAVAAGRANLGIVYRKVGDLERAESSLAAARDALGAALGADHPMVANTAAELGAVLWQRGRLREAEGELRSALASCLDKLGDQHLLTAWVRWALANVLRDGGSYTEAEALYRSSLEGRRSQLPADHTDIEQAEADLADLLRATGRVAEADALLDS